MNLKMKYKCIIFDCDGVLVDSEPIAHQVIVELANSYGANLTYEEAHDRFAGTFLSHVIAEIEKLIGKKIPDNFDYSQIKSMSMEARQKLAEIQPVTISQASRISGVSPNGECKYLFE